MNKLRGALNYRGSEVVQLAADRKAGKPLKITVPTGFTKLDKMGGLKRGIVTVVGAHSGVGKSTFAMYLVRAAAATGSVLWFSMEDPLPDTLDRIFSLETGIDSLEITTGEAVPEFLKARLTAADISWTDNVAIDDSRHSPNSLAETIHASIRDTTQLVVVDYAQVFHGDGKTGSLEPVIRRLTAELAGIAKKYNVSVVLFSQLRREALERGERVFNDSMSRAGGKREPLSGYRPAQEDLAWSSALLQYAKAVWLIDRPGVWAEKHDQPASDAFHVHVVKANFGRSGTVYLHADMAQMRIWQSADREENEALRVV